MPPLETYLLSTYLTPVVKNSLRCLGQEPAGYSSYWLCDKCERADSGWPNASNRIAVPECLPDRAQRLAALRIGMPTHEVVGLVGMPDVKTKRGWE
jgi:hypothetical protein